MALFNKSLNYFVDIAFGDTRDVFKNSYSFDLMVKPIGLRNKSYVYMMEHLYRNIGNAEFTYDGYSTPIGEMSNPFYNTVTRVPWFISDDLKNSTANYIEYARNVYEATLSVQNINELDTFAIDDDASMVGSVELEDIGFGFANNGDANYISINPNGTITDTHLGDVNKKHVFNTLQNAVKHNDRRKSQYFSITNELPNYFGIKTKSVVDNNVISISDKFSTENGRYVDGSFGPLVSIDGPLDDNNFGNISDLGIYKDFYDSLSEKSKEFYNRNISRNFFHTNFNGESNLYIDANYLFKDLEKNIVGQNIRYIFTTLPQSSNMLNSSELWVYGEDEYGSHANIVTNTFNGGIRTGKYSTYSNNLTAKDILKYTNDNFKEGKYKTIISRFHTDKEETGHGGDSTQTAVSEKYGMSHGRNLLKLEPDESQGYENPYCRVWTYHHQYHRIKDAIRPFDHSQSDLYNSYGFESFSADRSKWGFDNGRSRLARFGVTNSNNGLVNISPIDNGDSSRKVNIKSCMFSIENLAWKDMFSTDLASRNTYQTAGLSPEQKGPFGGRIMWFPPYNISFNEDVSVNWNSTDFIGRGESIYTYTNTSRSGNLSFTLLIDHPSVLNYWENRGKSVTDSVDAVEDPEQEILRFFAGCDMLTGKTTPEQEEEQTSEESDEIPAPESEYISFFVFFPNNYSGIDNEKDVKFAINYLTNGVGAGKERVKGYNGDKTSDYRVPYAPVYDMNSSKIQIGGYEVRPGKPISLKGSKGKQSEESLYIGSVRYLGEGSKTHSLYVQEGDSTDTWWNGKWYYRVDSMFKNQLLDKENYIDTVSYGLNSIKGINRVAEFFNIADKDKLYSFIDVFAAIEGDSENHTLSDIVNKERSASFLSKIQNSGIEKIECVGRASTQGMSEENEKLQKNRARIIKKWLANNKIIGSKVESDKITFITGGTGGNAVGNTGNVNDLENKLWRNTEVRVYIKKEKSDLVQNGIREQNILDENGENEQTILVNGSKEDKKTNFFDRAFSWAKDYSSNIQYEMSNKNSFVGNPSFLGIFGESIHNGDWTSEANSGGIFDFGKYTDDIKDRTTNLFGGWFNNDEKEGKSITESAKTTDDTLKEKEGKEEPPKVQIDDEVKRYDNEARFFTLLEKEEPFLHHKISDKVKYFDPAFHSISPEGFNARLTFLHQCTRQGPTIGSSDNYTADNTANNLAFGRQPVCILRIGDFFYTKILINNLQITYDQPAMKWDLNPEGIGVMPMFANVSMKFTFIGGSSLAGHIARLQNAVSFNYYANTEVYDDRAELAQYNENGDMTKFAPFNPRK